MPAILYMRTPVKATHPDFQYQPIAPPEELYLTRPRMGPFATPIPASAKVSFVAAWSIGDSGRIQWVSGRPGDSPSYAGTDFIMVRDGQIAALYLFLDKRP